MLVEDSRTVREFLTYTIACDPRLEVVAAVDSGEKALRILNESAPDVISMDIRLPGMDGFEATRRIMAERPTPIVVVAGNVEGEDLKISINALQAGALSVLEKPHGDMAETYEGFAARLCTQLAIMSQVKVVTLRDKRRNALRPAEPVSIAPRSVHSAQYEMIGIVASTGGPNALVEILSNIAGRVSVPILIVQHITSSFAGAFTEWLGESCNIKAVEAHNGQRPAPGCVYLPPADRHLVLRNGCLYLDNGSLVAMQRPSGDVLFQSMAETLGNRAVGVLLTGMGQDGARGLRAMHESGAHTIAEHESTAVVYGMPGAAMAMGAARESLPLHQIASRLLELTNTPRGND